jgi:hypothetical protein
MHLQQTSIKAVIQSKIVLLPIKPLSNPHLHDLADDMKEDVEDNRIRLQQQELVKDEEGKYEYEDQKASYNFGKQMVYSLPPNVEKIKQSW